MSSVIILLQPQHDVVIRDTEGFWIDLMDDDGDSAAEEFLEEEGFLPPDVLTTCGLPLTMMTYTD